jgi:hypothetical protein
MSTVILDKYTFSGFKLVANGVIFAVHSNSYKVTDVDAEKIKKLITENLGKWENLVKTSFQLFFELGFIQPTIHLASNYEQPSGIELYENPTVEIENFNRCLWVSISLTQDECEKRRNNNLSPLMKVEEIITQINNIPKWIDFEKTLTNLKKIN